MPSDNVLFAQVTDEDELKSGVRREAAFFGINALLTKPAQSISLILGPTLLELAGFVSSNPTQSLEVQFIIKMLIGLIPGLAVLLGAIILIWYPLKGDYLKGIKEKVLELHASKEAKLRS